MVTYSYNPYDIEAFFERSGGLAAGILAAVAAAYLLVMAVSLVLYILQSIGLFSMAKRRGIRNYGLAWVPVANLWILGSLADQYDLAVKGREKGYRRKLLIFSIIEVCLTILLVIASAIVVVAVELSGSNDPGLGGAIAVVVLALALLVICLLLVIYSYIALYKVFDAANPGTSTLFLVLSILFNVLESIFLFADRNKDLGFLRPAQPAPAEPAPAYIPQTPAETAEAPAEAPEVEEAPEAEPEASEEAPAENDAE